MAYFLNHVGVELFKTKEWSQVKTLYYIINNCRFVRHESWSELNFTATKSSTRLTIQPPEKAKLLAFCEIKEGFKETLYEFPYRFSKASEELLSLHKKPR